jgi:hypothetical protein
MPKNFFPKEEGDKEGKVGLYSDKGARVWPVFQDGAMVCKRPGQKAPKSGL